MKRNNTRIGRPRIKPEIRSVIFQAAISERDISRDELAINLKNTIEKEMGEKPPSRQTLVRMISEARNSLIKPEDQPWSIKTVKNYEIPPEALPSVFRVFVHVQKHRSKPFTIREAMWAARLSGLTTDIEKLSTWAIRYAGTERAGELFGWSGATSADDLMAYCDLTGEKLTREQQDKILTNQGEELLTPEAERFIAQFYEINKS